MRVIKSDIIRRDAPRKSAMPLALDQPDDITMTCAYWLDSPLQLYLLALGSLHRCTLLAFSVRGDLSFLLHLLFFYPFLPSFSFLTHSYLPMLNTCMGFGIAVSFSGSAKTQICRWASDKRVQWNCTFFVVVHCQMASTFACLLFRSGLFALKSN